MTMRILIVAPEANPFARSGALAEVIFGLSKALARTDIGLRSYCLFTGK